MLTCKVGNQTINCFDGTYDKYQLKKWSDKNLLICPDCGKPYEYCHGQIIPPYFRHKEKDKECDGIYSESETAEHINGKKILYNWLLGLQENGIISNVKLESYIKETKQRPDIYFEKDTERFVIEFQCSPIASEYLERHELYKLAGVNDIWILGTDKYNIKLYDIYGQHDSRKRIIEKNTQFYLDVLNKKIYFHNSLIKEKLQYGYLHLAEYLAHTIDSFSFIDNEIFVFETVLNNYISDDELHYLKHKKQIEENIRKQKEIEDRRLSILSETINMLKSNNVNFDISYRENCMYYNWAIDISLIYKNYRFEYVFFIKDKQIDFCRVNYNRPQYEKLDEFNDTDISDVDIAKFILKKISNYNDLMQSNLTCKSCGESFTLNLGEMMFFDNLSLSYPKRCKPCRDKRKQNTLGGR